MKLIIPWVIIGIFLVTLAWMFSLFNDEYTKRYDTSAEYAARRYLTEQCLKEGQPIDVCLTLDITVSSAAERMGEFGWLVNGVSQKEGVKYGASVWVMNPTEEGNHPPYLGTFYDYTRAKFHD